MSWYPFDIQRCNLVFIVKETMSKFVEPLADKLKYLGPYELSLYYVKNITIQRKILNGNPVVTVNVSLGRRLFSILLTIYLTTLIINVVGHISVFFKNDSFDTIINVNVTVMLVLTTMFIGVRY